MCGWLSLEPQCFGLFQEALGYTNQSRHSEDKEQLGWQLLDSVTMIKQIQTVVTS